MAITAISQIALSPSADSPAASSSAMGATEGFAAALAGLTALLSPSETPVDTGDAGITAAASATDIEQLMLQIARQKADAQGQVESGRGTMGGESNLAATEPTVEFGKGNTTAQAPDSETETSSAMSGNIEPIAAYLPPPPASIQPPPPPPGLENEAAPPGALAGLTGDSGEKTAKLAGDRLAPEQAPTPMSAPPGNTAGASETAAKTAPNVEPHLHDPHWAQSFGNRIVWLARNEQQTAQININPPQLGPVQITLQLNGDQASAMFASPHAEVRQAIQDAMPQLRDMLASAGINLGQANVGSQSPQDRQEFMAQFANQNRSSGEAAILPGDNHAAGLPSGQPIQRGRGLVDLFA